jgi:hypothetical protein
MEASKRLGPIAAGGCRGSKKDLVDGVVGGILDLGYVEVHHAGFWSLRTTMQLNGSSSLALSSWCGSCGRT